MCNTLKIGCIQIIATKIWIYYSNDLQFKIVKLFWKRQLNNFNRLNLHPFWGSHVVCQIHPVR